MNNVDNEDDPKLFFRISSGLKRIIGRDLIVSDFVAVFELVKNSFDAHAQNVFIVIDENSIWIIDDGKGMTEDDLNNKWLFVAYSAKRDGTEDNDYRGENRGSGAFAGNKGVGRFSCDRLGSKLTLQSKTTSGKKVETLIVNWDAFESDDQQEFVQIPVQHSVAKHFVLPAGVNIEAHGTALCITGIRDKWERTKLQELKNHLTKLINPFDEDIKSFRVSLNAKKELAEDEKIKSAIKVALPEQKSALQRQIINGPVENFIFSDLENKTTHIEIRFSEDKKKLQCALIDRGQLIYAIEEPNIFPELAEAKFSCKLFYLNTSAKMTFARRMGVPSVRFGSVFLFRNGFRVFPIGEEGDDTFELDRRKQQGYARYLGTREIIGRIDVHGGEELFREASSRDQGLIETPAYLQLVNCFHEKCLRRLEKYVVDVTWKDALDKVREDSSGLHSAPMRARIIELVSELVDAENITLFDYSEELINVLSDKVEQFEDSLQDLRKFAHKVGDSSLEKRIISAEKRFRDLQKAEARAFQIAEQEKIARKEAEFRARTANEARVIAEREKTLTQKALEEEKKRSLFLASVSSLDVETVTNLHHQVIICAADIDALIEMQLDKLNTKGNIDKDSLFSFLEQMRLKNQQVLAIARMATRANFRMESDEITDDIIAYVMQYLQNIASAYHRIKINVTPTEKSFIRSFKPIEVAIFSDNLISNARKANSPVIEIDFRLRSNAILEIGFTDQGDGLNERFSDPSQIFEKGVSTTEGSGLGLFHTRQIIESMGGSIKYEKPSNIGSQFIITLPKTK